MTLKLATGLWVYSNAQDRFCVEGYREVPRLQDIIPAIEK